MPNYQNGYIYKLWSLQTEKIYIGSSTTDKRKRLYQHKYQYKYYLKGGVYVSSFEIVKYPDAKIDIIELFPCNNRAELVKREGEIQRETECCNKNIAGRTKKEYYNDFIKKEKKIPMSDEEFKRKTNERNKKNYQKKKEKLMKEREKNPPISPILKTKEEKKIMRKEVNKRYYLNNKIKMKKLTKADKAYYNNILEELFLLLTGEDDKVILNQIEEIKKIIS